MDRGSQLDEEEEADEEAEDEEEKEEKEEKEEERKATDIKSNNPHLAGGELENIRYYEFQGENLRYFMKSIVVTSQGQALQASIYVF